MLYLTLCTSIWPRRVGLVVSVSAYDAEGLGSRPGPVIPKTIINMVQTAQCMASMC